jgi:hypothetical protein
MKPPNHNANDDSIPSIQHSTVTVRRLNKFINVNETNNDQKTGQVTVTKISRKKTGTTQRERSSSVAVINLGQSSIEMQSMINQLNNPSIYTDRKTNATTRINGTKI